MKIVYIYDNIARFGGVERILTDKMNYLAKNTNHSIYLITGSQGLHSYSYALSTKVKHIDINVPFHKQYQYKCIKRVWCKLELFKSFKVKLQKEIDNIHPDIIISTTCYQPIAVCSLNTKAKILIESHCSKEHTGKNNGIYRPFIFEIINRFLMTYKYFIIQRKSDVVIALTHNDALEWNSAKKTIIIPNIITKISSKTSSCTEKRVISVGRLTHQKGFDRLIKAWKIVSTKYPEWELHIYGEGTKDELIRQIHKTSLENKITIHNPTFTIYNKMQESSIYALSSRYEGFGLVLIEAMTNGLPCVSFDCPYGPSDIINDGEDGFLVPNGDIQAMADKICYLIENEEARKEMGRKAHHSAMRYAPENIMPMWEKLFNEIVKS